MAYRIYFENSDKHALLENNETILDVAIRAGIDVNYGCSNGNCGLCMARCLDGRTRTVQNSDYVFSRSQRDGKHFLMCSSTACSDLHIDASLGSESDRIMVQKFDARIKDIQCNDDGIIALRLRVPRSHRLRFHAGQCAVLRHPALGRGKYAIASCPCDARQLEFYFRSQDVRDAASLCDQLCKGDTIAVTAPYGDFVFTEDMLRKVVFFTLDVGFAAVKSLIEHITGQESDLPITLYRIFDPQSYFARLCRSWGDALDQFDDVALSQQTDPRLITNELKQHITAHQAPDECDFYLSAPEQITAAIRALLLQLGVLDERIFCQNISTNGRVE